MKRILSFLTLLMVVALYSCSKDEDSKEVSIIGTWQITHDGGSIVYNDGSHTSSSTDYPLSFNGQEYGYYWSYTFNGDGTCIWTTYADNREPKVDNRFTYSISNNTLTVKHKVDNNLDFVCEIKNNTADQLVLFYQEKTDTYVATGTHFYKRIK